jgi:hypothetical protein
MPKGCTYLYGTVIVAFIQHNLAQAKRLLDHAFDKHVTQDLAESAAPSLHFFGALAIAGLVQ